MHRVYKIDGSPIAVDQATMKGFEELGVSVEVRPCATEAEIITNCRDADGLVVMTEPITRTVLEALPHLKVIARPGVGVDSIDITAATELGVQVTNVPDGNYTDVATHALALILNGIRRLKDFEADVRAHGWNGQEIGRTIRRPSELTLGIIGFGRSGKRLAEMAAPIGFSTRANSPRTNPEQIWAVGAESMDFDELISTSDIVSLHVPLTDQTRNLIDKDALGRFKKGSFLVNVSRGGIIDEAALAEAVGSGHLAGAALDVFAQEPLHETSPLRSQPAITLTPHIAYLSADSLQEVSTTAFADIARLLKGQQVAHPVNTPQTNSFRWRQDEPR
ncbi:C-terminal binding protein [Arthrobacter sp. K5]|uniref:C-terminal binding protein n=1 Tax=Arthrobacter sp. K5 TaxID=2839623 RepID=A0AAU8EXT9_9MICC